MKLEKLKTTKIYKEDGIIYAEQEALLILPIYIVTLEELKKFLMEQFNGLINFTLSDITECIPYGYREAQYRSAKIEVTIQQPKEI